MDANATREFVEGLWDESIVPELETYIEIPALSPHFDEEWEKHGHIERAAAHIRTWCEGRSIEGLTIETVRLDGRTPVLFMEIPAFGGASSDRTVLLYGHMDKQPEMSGWDADKGPWKPVRIGDKLYGRGGADDGYSAYASLAAIEAVQRQGLKHDRCVVLIEGCEESGSFDLPFYLDHLEARIGTPSLVICLDSGCGNYDQLWSTTSLRGLIGGVLTIEIMEPTADGSASGVHSGDASGVVPSTFRILRMLLDRVEDSATGGVKLPEVQVEIPAQRREQAEQAATILGDAVWKKFPFHGGADPVARGADAILNRTWRSYLEVVGTDTPSLQAGNVLRGRLKAKLSIRIPPHVDPETATVALKKAFEENAPFGARVSFEPDQGAAGWEAPPLAPWLGEFLQKASRTFFDADAAFIGEGGTIPFMGMLGAKFPDAQFCITGVLGPASNAHGPNEFLHVPCAKKLTMCMASVLADVAAL